MMSIWWTTLSVQQQWTPKQDSQMVVDYTASLGSNLYTTGFLQNAVSMNKHLKNSTVVTLNSQAGSRLTSNFMQTTGVQLTTKQIHRGLTAALFGCSLHRKGDRTLSETDDEPHKGTRGTHISARLDGRTKLWSPSSCLYSSHHSLLQDKESMRKRVSITPSHHLYTHPLISHCHTLSDWDPRTYPN